MSAQPIVYRDIPLSDLAFSSTESQIARRKHFDKAGMADLSESIKSVGVLQPILVRPGANGHGKKFEVVAGERRAIAARQAGLETIGATVRELSDQQVLELQLIENLQREGLHELIEAEGYEALMKQHHYSIDDLIAKVGKSRAYVYARLKLCALGKAGRQAFYDGKISASIALLLARIPVEELQDKALDHIVSPHGGEESRWNQPLRYRDALDYIHENYTLRLSEAPFPRDDETLVLEAGTCGACPKRTGNQPELFGDIKGADVCTDPVCFGRKKAAHQKILVAKAKEDGQRVIAGSAARSLQSTWSTELRKGYVRPTDRCPEDPKKRTYAQLVGKDAPSAMLQHRQSGKFSKVFQRDEIADLVKKNAGVTLAKTAAEPAPRDYAAQEAKRRLEREQERAYQFALLKALYAKAPSKLGRDELITICGEMAEYGFDDLFKALGLPASGTIATRSKQLSEGNLSRLLFVLALQSDADNGEGKEMEAAAKRLGIDAAKLKADITAEFDKKRAAKSAKKTAKKKARK